MNPTALPRRRHRGWDWFPWWVTLALAVVIVVNAGMIWTALRTFPGAAGEYGLDEDGFDASNHYDKILAAEAQQRALGWHVTIGVKDADRVHVALNGPGDVPLPGATLTGTAERPVGPREPIALRFEEYGPGRFLTRDHLPRGQWEVLLTVDAAGHRYTTAARLVADARP